MCGSDEVLGKPGSNAVDLFPVPHFSDGRVRVAVEGGMNSYRERMEKHSTSRNRGLRITNLTERWIVAFVEFAYDPAVGPKAIPPGEATEILVGYSFESDRLGSGPIREEAKDPVGA